MANEALPLHMREFDEADEDAPLLPMYTVTDSSQSSENTIVDSVNDVQGGPDISYGRRSNFSFPQSEARTPDLPEDHAPDVKEFAVDREWNRFPKMNIVIMIVGSRGDVQPYVALGKRLRKDGHRIRIASHETFRSFVTEHGLEFFDIGGNPQDLMSYMVKNPGLIPGVDSITNGDIPKKRTMLAEMIKGCWLSCHSPCPRTWRMFAADAIIANPPSFAHIHCAEALGIPLLLSFNVVGFYFLDLATDYTPPDDLAAFLAAGDAPIYIGFGSVVVDNPATMTATIFAATKQAGVRALVSAGWGGLGGITIPSHIFILGNIPHDWLFANGRVAAVVHHGGAGTTAAGLSKGLPTVVVPFFGDQGFWGNMIHKAGAGPAPIPPKSITVDSLKDAIIFAISPAAKSGARRMAEQILHEDGVNRGVESFYRHLPLKNMRCDLDPSRIAVWWSTKHCLKLSAFAARVLVDARELDMGRLDLHRSKEYNLRKGVSDPITGGSSAVFWTITHSCAGVAKIFYSPVSGIIQTATALPQGAMRIVTSIHDGFQNAPKLYGSQIREPGKVTNFSSGLKEAGKGFVYGWYDGVTGLVREPIKGAQKDGFVGAIKGSARSFANAAMKPSAGIVGLMSHPMNGAWKSIRSHSSKHQEERQRRSTRILYGVEEVRRSTPQERNVILNRFREAKVTTSERQKSMAEAARSAPYGDAQGVAAEVDQKGETARRGDSDWREAAVEEVHPNAKRLLSGQSSQTDASR
ncbi:UDP-Glycosyltransferase/glycogen phosphorylase [Armillaria solidipes]|uniref:UDP-Glycosyltransferase/glycogen phosphorylase n=1 Tax=Armillaria solidipes TaxID=1076256 RepID=A0A2H3AZK8_9AGAR|nr:UDP-Glycosyltransferase/glycogen phosphorylase [Armillaria solidipes]